MNEHTFIPDVPSSAEHKITTPNGRSQNKIKGKKTNFKNKE